MNEQIQISASQIFVAFLKLGLTSFGGPIAHIGYFRTEFVERRAWVTEQEFAQLLSTSQFLPGPASSQLGFSIGLLKAGWLGAVSAFIAFTFPSVLLLIIFASLLPFLSGEIGQAMIHGLKLVACIVVADAVIGMAKSLCPDLKRRLIAMFSLVFLLLVTTPFSQMLVILFAAIIGILLFRDKESDSESKSILIHYSARLGISLLILFTLLLVGLPILATTKPELISVADAFYRAGALVFGGGHVVLPLLEESVVNNNWLAAEEFLAGYGASQAIPGPMFAFSAYLGMLIEPDNGYLFALVALVFMFLPGFLLLAGVLPYWNSIANNKAASGMVASVNAAVVGLLAATLYDPIVTSGITNYTHLVIALIGFAILFKWRVSPLLIVLFCISSSLLATLFFTS